MASSAALLCAVALAVTGCNPIAQFNRHNDKLPPNVKGAPMEPMPTTRQQAQDAVYRYYVKTLRELPEGYALDNTRCGGLGAQVVTCDDDSPNRNTAPAEYGDARTILTPPGTNNFDLVAKLGDIWKNWGWRVEERDGFNKPNRFATASDGYKLSVEADGQYPVMLKGTSPCFSGGKERFNPIPNPTIITRDGAQTGAPAKPPEAPEKPSKAFNW